MKALIFLFLISCTQFVQNTDEDYFKEFSNSKAVSLNLFFSHNINGETHPCGCRKFPLGGIPHINGVIKSSELPALYVDTGDTFFKLPVVPNYIRKSTEFTARKIAESMDHLGLRYLTLGDQDFALGESFLVELSKKHKFQFLISNASPVMKIEHKKLGVVQFGDMKLFFIGVTDPSLVSPEYRKLFTPVKEAIAQQLSLINKKYSSVKNKRVILLSHSGIDADQKIAENFKGIDWIIGGHTQSFLRKPVKVGSTRIAQTLSRNHYLGQITLPKNQKAKVGYTLVSIKEETKDLIKDNPLVAWLDNYKSELDKIQLNEQDSVAISADHKFLPTFISCNECHTKQTEFWQKTAHSLAFKTLIDANAANNQTCIECHSVGFKDAKGFLVSKNIIRSDKKDFNLEKYWEEFSSGIVNNKKPIRDLSSKQRLKFSKKLADFDAANEVTHNFSNVQCLNCHNQSSEHPFDVEVQKGATNYQEKCLACHTSDQSPEWYHMDDKKLATGLNKKYFEHKLKEVSCPKIENN